MRKEKSYLSLFNSRILRGLLSLSFKGYFVERGWIDAYKKKQATDENGNPIPWLTYSFLDFLRGRLHKELTLFEYGSGNSTLFFAKHLKYVRSIEHDEAWYNKVKVSAPQNVDISYIPLEDETGDYETAVSRETQHYDIILIDGRRRVMCLKNAVDKLSENGVIILDDSEREEYSEAFTFMHDRGFRSLPFSGIAIGAIHNKCTTVFYRTNNVLNI